MDKEHKAVSKKSTTLVVGLGNPGQEFENTYHNAGAEAVESLRKKLEMPTFKKSGSGRFVFSKSENIILALPMSFMNESGETVREIAKYFKLSSENIVVMHDDADIQIGKWKEGRGQGAAGHNGVASVISSLKTNDFKRIRIGIRSEKFAGTRTRVKAGEFVLRKESAKEQKILKEAFEEIADKIFQAV